MAHFHGSTNLVHLHGNGEPAIITPPAPQPAQAESPTAYYRRNARDTLAGRRVGDGAEVMLAIGKRRRR